MGILPEPAVFFQVLGCLRTCYLYLAAIKANLAHRTPGSVQNEQGQSWKAETVSREKPRPGERVGVSGSWRVSRSGGGPVLDGAGFALAAGVEGDEPDQRPTQVTHSAFRTATSAPHAETLRR